jgi:RNA polymerase subunit RPABC4/transcription elongation factor Spt4
VQPKTRTLDETRKRCPRCGLHQAVTQQVDHYFSLFFIPLIRVKRGDPFLYCQRCRQPVDSMGAGTGGRPSNGPQEPMCRQCGRTLSSGFRYCPYCGRRQ